METYVAVGLSVVGAALFTALGWVIKTLFSHGSRISSVEAKLNGRLLTIEKKLDTLLSEIEP